MGGSTRGKPRNASDGQESGFPRVGILPGGFDGGEVLGRIDGGYRFSDVSDLCRCNILPWAHGGEYFILHLARSLFYTYLHETP